MPCPYVVGRVSPQERGAISSTWGRGALPSNVLDWTAQKRRVRSTYPLYIRIPRPGETLAGARARARTYEMSSVPTYLPSGQMTETRPLAAGNRVWRRCSILMSPSVRAAADTLTRHSIVSPSWALLRVHSEVWDRVNAWRAQRSWDEFDFHQNKHWGALVLSCPSLQPQSYPSVIPCVSFLFFLLLSSFPPGRRRGAFS
ncbi:hypothetical protein LX36DRAFT_286921 [Colletotrichum falcatum]|nr:hypothetical protein LX36DRAFT_286921 [Colletotrichum falcatum]